MLLAALLILTVIVLASQFSQSEITHQHCYKEFYIQFIDK